MVRPAFDLRLTRARVLLPRDAQHACRRGDVATLAAVERRWWARSSLGIPDQRDRERLGQSSTDKSRPSEPAVSGRVLAVLGKLEGLTLEQARLHKEAAARDGCLSKTLAFAACPTT